MIFHIVQAYRDIQRFAGKLSTKETTTILVIRQNGGRD